MHLKLQCFFFHIPAQPIAGFGMIQGNFQRSFQEAAEVSGIIPAAFKVHSDHALLMAQGLKAVGQLDLPAVTGGLGFQNIEDFGRQNITAQNGIIGKFFLRRRLLIQIRHGKHPLFQL